MVKSRQIETLPREKLLTVPVTITDHYRSCDLPRFRLAEKHGILQLSVRIQ